LNVANNGVDSPTCGARKDPCRSISQAITNAANGDTIRVGPGQYGDLNGDGVFSEPGEELQRALVPGIAVWVNKPLRILSTSGASATVIRGMATDVQGPPTRVVLIQASDVVFGLPGHGFTLTGPSEEGLSVGDILSNVRVAGNVALNIASECTIVRGGTTAEGCVVRDKRGFTLALFGGPFFIHDNIAIGNVIGFQVFGVRGAFFRRNLAVSNSLTGISLGGIIGIVGGLVATDNEASSNGGDGFFVGGGVAQVRGNTAVSNLASGFNIEVSTEVEGVPLTSHVVRNNSIGNGGPGFAITRPDVSVPTIEIQLNRNNIYGNDSRHAARNCGVLNSSGLKIDATNNFWGAATGPGADPADNGGSSCDQNGSVTVVAPFATTRQ
jgi:hypothetical protein